MNKEIKQGLTRNWFKLLQDIICNDIEKLENNKIRFNSKTWSRNEGKDEGNKIVCRNEKPLGSNIAERVCYTVAQLKAREEADKESFRRDNNIFEPAGG